MREFGTPELGSIQDDLSAFGFSAGEESLKKFIELSTKYCLRATSLVEKFVAFHINRGLSDSLTLDDISLFEKEALLPTSVSKSLHDYETVAPGSLNELPLEMRREILSTAASEDQNDIVSSYLARSESTRFPNPINTVDKNLSSPQSIKAACKVICSFSNWTDGRASCHQLSPLLTGRSFACELRTMESQEPDCFKYMYQKPLKKAEILDSWTWSLVTRIMQSIPSSTVEDCGNTLLIKPRFYLSSVLNSKPEDSTPKKPSPCVFQPLHRRIQTPSLVAGRVAVRPENAAGEGETRQRLDPLNVCIVGAKRAGGGDLGQIMLDLNAASSILKYSLYPGQPIVIKATNTSGRSLVPLDIYQPRVLPPLDTKGEKLYADEPDLHVAVACGPFTPNASHDISPLLSLLKIIKEQRPHVLIMLGPLVDSSHPLIGEYCDTTFDQLYQMRLNTVAEWCYLLQIKVVIVSSWREICGDPVYPTPPAFTSKPPWAYKNSTVAAWYENVTFVWDPSTIQIGPYCLGLSSPDVLFMMSSEEISANCTGDRLARICRHILASGTYYPVHPAFDDLPFDYPLWWNRAQMPRDHSPHCVILPSRLKTFIKEVEGVVCVNPGLAARSSSVTGGSFARLIFSTNPNGIDATQSPQVLVRDQVTIQGEILQF